MLFSPNTAGVANHNLQAQIARDFNNSMLRVSSGPTPIPISINRNPGLERQMPASSTLRSTYIASPLAPQMTQRIIRRSPSEGTHAFGLDALKRSLHQQRESNFEVDTVSVTGDGPRASSHRYVSSGSLANSGIRQGQVTPSRTHTVQVVQNSQGRSPSTNLNADMKASMSSRVSHETQTVHMLEPRIVGINRMAAVEKSVKNLEPVLIEVRRAENITSTEGPNIKNMLVDCYKRID